MAATPRPQTPTSFSFNNPEGNDPTLWNKLLDHTITEFKRGFFKGMPVTLVTATRRTDTVQDWNQLLSNGMNLHILTLDGETNYLSPKAFDFVNSLDWWSKNSREEEKPTTLQCPGSSSGIELIPLGVNKKQGSSRTSKKKLIE